MKLKKEGFLYNLFSGLCAGVMIGVGGTVYLACESKVVGSLLFCIGLVTVCTYGLKLFTGAIGYLLTDGTKPLGTRLAQATAIWLGNLCGTWLTAQAVLLSRPVLAEKAGAVAVAKLALAPGQVFILAVFCGMLMYLGVDIYRNQQGTHRLVGIFLAVPVFILAGFEHSIANMYYLKLGMGTLLHGQTMVLLLVATLGNSLGAALFAGAQKILATAKS